MKALRTWLLALFLMGCVLATPALAADTVASGTCGAEGSNLTWTLDSEGVLTISGTGAMKNYNNYDNRAAWYANRDSIKTVSIGSGVTSVGTYAFYDCKNLTGVMIPDSVTRIGRQAFYNCSNLQDVNVTDMDAWCQIAFGDLFATPMFYAENLYLNGKPVTSVVVPQGVTILYNTFRGFKDLTQVTLPDSLTSIGWYAFTDCSSLVSINIPDNVTSIGKHAFTGCSKLINASIGSNVTSIDDGAFDRCSSLVSITIPDSVTSIGSQAFMDCSSLTNITIGSGVSSIGSEAFSRCSSLTDVYLADMDAWCRITFGGDYSTPMWYAKNIYLKEEKITSVTMPQGITTVQYTFCGFQDLVTVTIPDSVTSIGERAFCSCSSLTGITIPDSVTSISSEAFQNCASLQSITIGSGVTSISGSSTFSSPFYNCKNLESVYITDMAAWCGIAFESNYANPLYYAKNLYLNGAKVETLEIPEGVESISQYAFIDATCVKRVVLPKSLSSVAVQAFSGCSGIEKVYYVDSEDEWSALTIETGNDPLTNAQIVYNSCRITVKTSDGGTVSVDQDLVGKGETVTVTAVPDEGYELMTIYVDGVAIEGNTFTVTGNHEVSALFTKLPVTGGTQDYRLEGITVQTAEGEKLQELTAGKLLVSVSVRHLQGTEGATILLAQYDAQGRYQGLLWLTLDEMPLDMALKVTLPVDNSDGKIVHLKAFVVDSLLSAVPVGSAVSFGDV